MNRGRGAILSASGESRSAMATMERDRLIEHFAALRTHNQALIAQVLALGGSPISQAAAAALQVEEAEAELAIDLTANPPAPTTRLAQRLANSTTARIHAFLRSHGEASPGDIAKAIGVTYAAVSVALSKRRDEFRKRKVKRRVLYRLPAEGS